MFSFFSLVLCFVQLVRQIGARIVGSIVKTDRDIEIPTEKYQLWTHLSLSHYSNYKELLHFKYGNEAM